MTIYPPPPQTTSGASGPRAGFWKRFAALVLDGLVMAVAWVPLVIIAVAADAGWIVVLVVPLYIAYEIYYHGGPSGQTYGKKWMGIRVVDFNTGGPIGYGRSTIRVIGRYISGFLCDLGYFWMLWDKEKQCWHDKMANDVVVPTSHYPVQR